MDKSSIKLISWNINQGGGKRVDRQIESLRKLQPNIVALQEMTLKNLPIFRDKFFEIGYKYIMDSFQSVDGQTVLKGPRRYGLIIASHWKLTSIDLHVSSVPWPEKVLSVLVHSPYGIFEVHTAHIPPGSSNGWTKIDTLNGLYEKLAHSSNTARILCGDFNTPKEEWVDGQVITWGQKVKEDGSIVFDGRRGEEWDKGERNILTGLKEYDLADVYRSLNGYGVQEFSWYLKRKTFKVGRRFDHVFASSELNPIQCRYIHSLRENKLSDHSPIEVIFEISRTRKTF